jgi:tetratricopeptide (TPR) repeat protein
MSVTSLVTSASRSTNQPTWRRQAQALLLLLLAATPFAHSFSTPLTGTPLNDGYHALYNLDFPTAHGHFQHWIAAHPDDCLGPASDAAAYLFTEFDLLGVLDIELFADDDRFTSRKRPDVNPTLKQGFQDRIAQAERLADTALQRNPNDANAFYCKAVTSGMQADWASLIDRHEYGAFKYSETASKYAKQALAINPTLYDANLAVGIENYMLSLKAAPIRWILGLTGAGTNKAEGVRLLKLTAEQGHYLAPFARLMLAVGELRDGRTQQGKAILIALSEEFPKNTLYQRQIARLH